MLEPSYRTRQATPIRLGRYSANSRETSQWTQMDGRWNTIAANPSYTCSSLWQAPRLEDVTYQVINSCSAKPQAIPQTQTAQTQVSGFQQGGMPFGLGYGIALTTNRDGFPPHSSCNQKRLRLQIEEMEALLNLVLFPS
jgi:hypothetical protein